MVDTEARSTGVPYLDYFVITNRTCLTQVAPGRTRVRVTSDITQDVWSLIGGKWRCVCVCVCVCV